MSRSPRQSAPLRQFACRDAAPCATAKLPWWAAAVNYMLLVGATSWPCSQRACGLPTRRRGVRSPVVARAHGADGHAEPHAWLRVAARQLVVVALAAALGAPLSAASPSPELFTDDAFAGMLALNEYIAYVDSLEDKEAAPGCEACADQRKRLEQAWQTVSNEAFSGTTFTQAEWARQLFPVLKQAGGLLHSPAETSRALSDLMTRLQEPYSAYLPPSEWRSALRRPLPVEREYAAAQAVGVGVQLGMQDDHGILIAAPLAGSPAEAAGVRTGDVLVAVDDVPVKGLAADAVQAVLRGPDGSDVSLTLMSARPMGIHSVTVTRRALPLPPLPLPELLALPDGGGGGALLLRIRYFSSDGTSALAKAIRYGEAAGVSGYIIDLRNNPGGVLEEAIAAAADFAPCGTRLAQTTRASVEPEVRYVACALPAGQFAAPPPGPLTSRPVVVIVNEATASAAEAFAAGLRDAHGAKLVGTPTFGKSQVQFFFPLDVDELGGLRITVMHWLTPQSGDDVARTPRGLRPDLACDDYPRKAGEPPDACLRLALRTLARDAA
jgi:carboxyl-terminal processing protease